MTLKHFRTWTILALCAGLGALTACSTTFVKPGYDFQSVGKVAVLITMNAGTPEQQQQVADLFALHVLQKNYDVVDRPKLADLTREAAFQSASGITSPEGRAKLARDKVSAVIVVNVHMPVGEHWRERYGYADEDEVDITLKAQMLDVRTGTLLWSGEGVVTLNAVMEAYGIEAPPAVPGVPVEEKPPAPVIGGIAGAAPGATAGEALQPEMAKYIRTVIERTCEELPARAAAAKSPGTP
ncbi:MAG: hypothetical protein ACLQVA_00220 [Candidatus Brocadiia bacterium]